MKECDDSSDCKDACGSIANSNARFDSSVPDSSDLMGSTEKNDDAVQPSLATPNRIEDKAICLTPEEIVRRASVLPY